MLTIDNLHTYQRRAIRHIIDTPRCALFLDMGLGKTAITLTALNHLHNTGELKNTLIIAPLRVARTTWIDETAKWKHLEKMNIVPILGTEKERLEALTTPAHCHIINRENVVWLVNTLGTKWFFDSVVIDELSSFKSHSSKRFKALKSVITKAQRVVGLTGTPAPNSLMDLWSQMFLIDNGKRLGQTITRYRDAYFVPGRRNAHIIYEYIPRRETPRIIQRKLSDVCLSMKASEYLELPDAIYRSITVSLDEKTKEHYEEYEREMVLSMEDEELTAANAAVLSNHLRQFTSGAIYTGEDGRYTTMHTEKIETLKEICDTATSPILVAYNYIHEKERILKAIPQARVLSTTEDMIAWNRGEIPVALGHPASLGHGLNLQAGGNTIIWFTLVWSLELYQQFNARLHRQGQKHTVTILHMVCKGTIDEVVVRVLSRKDKQQDALLNAIRDIRAKHIDNVKKKEAI